MSAVGAADGLEEPERLRYLGRVAERALRLETLDSLAREPRLGGEPLLAERVWAVHAHHHGLGEVAITHHLLGLGNSPRDRSDFERLLRALEQGSDIDRRWIEPYLILGPLEEHLAPLRDGLRESARTLTEAADALRAEPRALDFQRFERHRGEFLDLARDLSRLTAGLEPTPQLRIELDALRDLYARSVASVRSAPEASSGSLRPEGPPRPVQTIGETVPDRRQLERAFMELSHLLGSPPNRRPLAETQARFENVLERLAAQSAAHQRADGRLPRLHLDVDDHRWPALHAAFEQLSRPTAPALQLHARTNLAARLAEFTANPHTGGLAARDQRWADHALLSGLSPRYVREMFNLERDVPFNLDPHRYATHVAGRALALAERLRPRLEARLASLRTAALARLPREMRAIVQAAGVLTGKFTPLGAAGFLIGLARQTRQLLERTGRAHEGRSR